MQARRDLNVLKDQTLAQFCQMTGADPLTEIEITRHGRVLLNAAYWRRMATEVVKKLTPRLREWYEDTAHWAKWYPQLSPEELACKIDRMRCRMADQLAMNAAAARIVAMS